MILFFLLTNINDRIDIVDSYLYKAKKTKERKNRKI